MIRLVHMLKKQPDYIVVQVKKLAELKWCKIYHLLAHIEQSDIEDEIFSIYTYMYVAVCTSFTIIANMYIIMQ